MNLNQQISATLAENNFLKNNFFTNLSNGEMTKEQFVLTQKQFYFAVIHFSAPLAFVAGNIPTYEDRISIIKNLWEEHGEGNLTHTHGKTFIEFLKRLSPDAELKLPAPEEAVVTFNQTLNEVTKNGHFLKGVAIIGMIEHMFADISSYIGAAVVERGWMKQHEMIHYSVHQELDCIHAQDFFSILEKNYSPENQEMIQQGLNLGADCFLALYSKLWEQAREHEILICSP